MNTQDNGGAAFPSPNNVRVGDCISGGHQGMDLRDYFAAKAMQSLMPMDHEEIAAFTHLQDEEGLTTISVIVQTSYMLADAMLKARQG